MSYFCITMLFQSAGVTRPHSCLSLMAAAFLFAQPEFFMDRVVGYI